MVFAGGVFGNPGGGAGASGMVGPTGPQGPAGPSGATGPSGAAGQDGLLTEPVDAREASGSIIPDTDNAYDIGSVGNRWNQIVAASGFFGEPLLSFIEVAKQISIINQDTEAAISITQDGLAPAIDIVNNANNAAIFITNNGSEPGIDIRQDGQDEALRIIQSTNRAVMDIDKTGTGTGDVLQIGNAGTGRGIIIVQSGPGRAFDILHTEANEAICVDKTDTTDTSIAVDIRNAGLGTLTNLECPNSVFDTDAFRIGVSGFAPEDFNFVKYSNPSGIQFRVRGDGTLFATSGVFGSGTTFITGDAVMCDTLHITDGFKQGVQIATVDDIVASGGSPYRAWVRHIASGSAPVAMSVNATPQDFSVPDLMGEWGTSFGTYSAPEFTINEAGTYRIELTAHFEGTVDAPVITPDAAAYVYLDTGSGFAELFRVSGGASDENDPREIAHNYFIIDLNPGDVLKVLEHSVTTPTNNLNVLTWGIEKKI